MVLAGVTNVNVVSLLLQQAELKEAETAWEAVVETGLQLASTSIEPGLYVPVS